MTPATIEAWHRVVAAKDRDGLRALLADEVTFRSPVVHSPQVGKAITAKYLESALALLNNEHFRYTNEWYGERSAVLEFETAIDGIAINGVDIIAWNEAGRIVDFKVMIRPLKAINLVHQKMGQHLAALA